MNKTLRNIILSTAIAAGAAGCSKSTMKQAEVGEYYCRSDGTARAGYVVAKSPDKFVHWGYDDLDSYREYRYGNMTIYEAIKTIDMCKKALDDKGEIR